MSKIISFVSSMLVVGINVLLLFLMRRISIAEKHSTLTNLNVSLALKLTFARFLNSTLILIFTNHEPGNWFKEGDLAYDATLLLCIMAFSPPLKMIVWIPKIIKKIKIYFAVRDGLDKCKLT